MTKLIFDAKHFCAVFLIFTLATAVHSQINFTANDGIKPYTGGFRAGVNFDIYRGFTSGDQAILAAGSAAQGVTGVGVKAIRPSLQEDFAEAYGYDAEDKSFAIYDSIGLKDNTLIVGFPSAAHRDTTFYCPGIQSTVFKNMDLPIWDNGKNGTPVNDDNYYALYIYKLATRYKGKIKFYEVWNEPGFDYTGDKGALFKGFPDSWWDNNPSPCDYKLRAPIFNYIRLLRITYEVVKYVDANAYVMTSGLGYPSFLDAILRNTDNSGNGKIDATHPLKGGAYFDGIGFHSYPHFDGALRSYDSINLKFINFRHSDAAAQDPQRIKTSFEEVLKTYGYNGTLFPKKLYIITEANLPRFPFGDFVGSAEIQRNWIIKAYVNCTANDIYQMHIFKIAEETTPELLAYEFDVMGLYKKMNYTDKLHPEVNDEGIALRTSTQQLFGKKYDASRTQAMNLPNNINGAAFIDSVGIYTYVIWAKTTVDLSEVASATYSFPSNLGISNLQKRDWNASVTNALSYITTQNIALTASPIFLTEARVKVSSQNICVGQFVTFEDNANGTWSIENQSGVQQKSGASFIVSYIREGSYKAVYSNAGKIQQTFTIQVTAAPQPSFVYSLFNPQIILTNTSSPNYDKLVWNFGDGTTSTLPNKIKYYETSGSYPVTLTLTNLCGEVSFVKNIAITAAQIKPLASSALNKLPMYNPFFKMGVNMRYADGWTDQQIGNIAAGSLEDNVVGVSSKGIRTQLGEYFTDYWGADIRKPAFEHFRNIDLQDIVLNVGYPKDAHQDTAMFCYNQRSELFKNMYTDIWDSGADGTPVNDSNYIARYFYDLAVNYKNTVKYWEIWDTPGWDIEGRNGYKKPGEEGNWWQTDPNPCELGVFSSVQNIVRMYRIAYEVIKSVDPNAYIVFSGAGNASFFDAINRNTDNPEGGKISKQFPLKGGAYFDAVSYTVSPLYDGSLLKYNKDLGYFQNFRNTDFAVQSVINRKNDLETVSLKYGFDGLQYPKKKFIISEINVPRKALGSTNWGSDEIQRNFIVKSYITAAANNIIQMHVKNITEETSIESATDGSQVQGLYKVLLQKPYSQTLNIEGIAFKSTSDILYGSIYDSVKTKAMNLLTGVKGAAFKHYNGKYTYTLWGESTQDLVEFSNVNYTFPANFTQMPLYKREWSFSNDNKVTTITNATLQLGTTPIFLSEDTNIVKPPVAAFLTDSTKGCAPFVVHYHNKSSENGTLLWQFDGGTPATSTSTDPTVTYSAIGNYTVRLTSTNAVSNTYNEKTSLINIQPKPKADFSFTRGNNSRSVQFVNNTANSYTMIWDFGDGTPFDQTLNPLHFYSAVKVYTVKLIAQNLCGNDTIVKKVNLLTTTNDVIENHNWNCQPNPVSDVLTINLDIAQNTRTSIFIGDLLGRVIETVHATANLVAGKHIFSIDLGAVSSSVYLVFCNQNGVLTSKKIVKM